jgi:hypothetical protein
MVNQFPYELNFFSETTAYSILLEMMMGPVFQVYQNLQKKGRILMRPSSVARGKSHKGEVGRFNCATTIL